MSTYNRGHKISRRESVGTTLRTRRSLRAVALIKRGGRQLPLQIMLGNPEEAVRRGWGGQEKEYYRVRTEGHTGAWHRVGLESDGVGGRDVS